MSSNPEDLFAWVARELQLAVLVDPEPTQSSAPTLEAQIEEATAIASGDDALLLQTLRRAREGGRASMKVPGGGTLVAWGIGNGRARVALDSAAGNQHLRRQAATADLAAGVTHEVANALTAIAGWTDMASASEALPRETARALKVVRRSTEDALVSTRRLLRTMRDSHAGPKPLVGTSQKSTCVSRVASEVLATLRPELMESNIELREDLEKDVWGAVPPAALRLVLGNLTRNAFEALGPDGLITVRLQSLGDRMRLSVQDNGPGMSPATLKRAFERYFTTKADGTGLGLALVRDTIDEAGGQLKVRTQTGEGTQFDVWLPIVAGDSLSTRPPEITDRVNGTLPSSPPKALDVRVLVVDDDEALRMMIATALQVLGAEVEVAGSKAEALETSGVFDVALIDLALGEDRGDELIDALRTDQRATVVILLTGATLLGAGVQDKADALLRKPFVLADLIDAIEALLPDARETLPAAD